MKEQRTVSLKERIESNLVVFFLGSLVAGFLAGVAAYDGTLRIAGRATIADDVLRDLERDLVKAREKLSQAKKQIEQPQQWIDLRRVDFYENAIPGTRYRIVLYVDGVPYSYPPQAFWWEIGKSVEAPKLPLPRKSGDRRVEAEVILHRVVAQEQEGHIEGIRPEHHRSTKAVTTTRIPFNSHIRIKGHHWEKMPDLVDIAFEIRDR